MERGANARLHPQCRYLLCPGIAGGRNWPRTWHSRQGLSQNVIGRPLSEPRNPLRGSTGLKGHTIDTQLEVLGPWRAFRHGAAAGAAPGGNFTWCRARVVGRTAQIVASEHCGDVWLVLKASASSSSYERRSTLRRCSACLNVIFSISIYRQWENQLRHVYSLWGYLHHTKGA